MVQKEGPLGMGNQVVGLGTRELPRKWGIVGLRSRRRTQSGDDPSFGGHFSVVDVCVYKVRTKRLGSWGKLSTNAESWGGQKLELCQGWDTPTNIPGFVLQHRGNSELDSQLIPTGFFNICLSSPKKKPDI